ncbi:replication initiation protein, partial [Bifidobacterium longum subsp. longum]
MTEKIAQPTLELPRAFEAWYLPQRPLCCDADYSLLRRRSRAEALKHTHIETNPSALVNMLVVDIDAAEGRAMALWEHQGMMPNLVMENPANGHAHAAWVLAAPVCRTDVARLKPLKLARSVTEGLRRSCDGDTGYAGLLMKNPLSGAWSSEITAPDAYALDQLRAALEEHGDMPP